MKRRLPFLLLLVAVPHVRAGDDAATDAVDVPGFWTEGELARIDEGLAVVNASRADLGFDKQPIEDPFRLDVVRRALDDPLSMGREAAQWDRICRSGDVRSVLAAAAVTLHGTVSASSGAADAFPNATAAVAAPAREALADLLRHVHWAKYKLLRARDDLGKDVGARRRLLEKALRTQVESLPAPDDLLDEAAFLDAVRAVDRKGLAGHGCDIAAAIADLVAVLRTIPAESFPAASVVVEDTLGGVPLRVAIGGTGPDVHEATDADVVIDFGGDDTYARGASANLLEGRAVSVGIDLSGDDRYVGGNDLSFGGALGGVAVQWDGGGNDVYVAGHVSFGAGILGVGVLVDEGGDDMFRAKDFCEGAGAFGIGVLLKKGGNDLYHADLFGQGFASTWGCGVLADLAGNDTYDAGGAHLHQPLYRDRYQALSQGFAIGMRPAASGGVGVLVDVSGNDRYATDIYGQGSSYWYSLGLLIDDDGHDTYSGTHYCQGTGIHLSAGMLLDRAGNDSYYCLNGVGIGGSHDFAAGILLDRGGDDYYAGSGASQGCGHTNSVGLLIDGGGDDGYAAVRGLTQGDASTVRGSGGIGLLLDAGGKDVYTEATRDEGVWIRGLVGAGIDAPSTAVAGGEPQSAVITREEAEALVAERCRVEGRWDLDRLWELSSEWAVNDNRVIVPLAREKLWALGAPALDRAIDRLGSVAGGGLEYENVLATLRHFPKEDVVPRLIAKTGDTDASVRRGALGAMASVGADAAYGRLVEMLEDDPGNRRGVLAALGAIRRAPPEVAALLRSGGELEGVNAAICLGAAGDDASIAALAGALGSDVAFLPRTAAVEQLATMGAKAVPALAKLAGDEAAPAMARRNALRALGRGGDPASAVPIIEALHAKDRWIRLSAYDAARRFLEKADAADRTAVQAALDAARASEDDPLLRRLHR